MIAQSPVDSRSSDADNENSRQKAESQEDRNSDVDWQSELRLVLALLKELSSGAVEIIKVRIDRLIEEAREKLLTIALLAWLSLFGLVFSIAMGVRLASGLSGAMSALLGDREWAGDLSAGLLIVGGMFLLVAIVRSRMRRQSLDKLRRKYFRSSDTADTTHSAE